MILILYCSLALSTDGQLLGSHCRQRKGNCRIPYQVSFYLFSMSLFNNISAVQHSLQDELMAGRCDNYLLENSFSVHILGWNSCCHSYHLCRASRTELITKHEYMKGRCEPWELLWQENLSHFQDTLYILALLLETTLIPAKQQIPLTCFLGLTSFRSESEPGLKKAEW